jgi:hypothetical protein
VLFAVSSFLGLGFFDFIGRNGAFGGGGNSDDVLECSFLSDARARELFGGDADATDLSGFFQGTLGGILDDRVLPDDPDCWVTDGDRASIARVALHQGGDAAAVYAAERQKAQPSSQDQGNGVTLENPGYFDHDISGLGDEAFCTDFSFAGMAGVVVHQGDRVLYVSVGPPTGQGAPDLSQSCPTAQEVARAILG